MLRACPCPLPEPPLPARCLARPSALPNKTLPPFTTVLYTTHYPPYCTTGRTYYQVASEGRQTAESSLAAATADIAQLRGANDALAQERDALAAIVDQQETAMKLQNRQVRAAPPPRSLCLARLAPAGATSLTSLSLADPSHIVRGFQTEAALKALQQRQETLAKVEQGAGRAEDELARLQVPLALQLHPSLPGPLPHLPPLSPWPSPSPLSLPVRGDNVNRRRR